MNIFYLDHNPITAVQWYVDSHVVKMNLEYAQLLTTALHIVDKPTPEQSLSWYKTTHQNHPCAIWTRASINNWLYLKELATALNDEWKFRYNHFDRSHKSFVMVLSLPTPKNLPNGEFTKPPSCMDNKYKVSECVIENYKNYYKHGKAHLHKWTNRKPPEWLLN